MSEEPPASQDEDPAEAGDDSEVRKALSGLRLKKEHAPDKFDEDVTDLIRKRSAGAFFARRTFGDRVPFGVLAILALVALAVIAYVLASSSTGSLKRDPAPSPSRGSNAPSIAPRL
jgi:hypothetical protein